jgi:transmembrane sensor
MDSFPNTPHPIQTIITKFLQKEASDEELDVLKKWIEEDHENLLQFEKINDTFQSLVTVTKFNAGKTDNAWRNLAERIEEDERTTIISIPSHYPIWLKVAASLTFLAVSYFIFTSVTSTNQNLVQTQTLVQNSKGNKTRLLLPDSSIVYLNANSTLKYSDDFGKTSRTVKLQGEGFFDIRKGKHDFIVTTQNLSIQVKGTKFNVTSADVDGTEKTTLEEGHVMLQVKGKKGMYSMKPGDQIMFNAQSKKVVLKKVNPQHYSAWKEDQLRFENTPLRDIVLKLENRYKVNITIDSVLARKEWITMTIENENIEEVLELIKLSSRLEYKITAKEIIIFE